MVTKTSIGENGLSFGLGGLLKPLQSQAKEYEKIIDNFKKIDLDDAAFKIFDQSSGNMVTNWNAISSAIGDVDGKTTGYLKTLQSTNGTINKSSASINGMNKYLKTTGQSFDIATKGAKALDVALNALEFALISMAVAGIAKLVDSLVTTFDEQKQITQDLQSEFNNLQNEEAGINTELDSTIARIDELNGKESLSFLEKDELANLQATNEELSNRLRLIKEQEEIKQKEIAESKAKEFDKQYGDKTYQRDYTEETLDKYNALINTKQAIWDKGILNITNEESDTLDTIMAVIDEFNKPENKTTDFEGHVANLIDVYNELNDKRKSGIELDEEQQQKWQASRDELVGLGSDLESYIEEYKIDDETSRSWRAMANAIEDCLYPAEELTEKFNGIYDGLSDSVKNELERAAVEGTLSVESFSDDTIAAFEDAGFTVEEVIDQIESKVLEGAALLDETSLIPSVDLQQEIADLNLFTTALSESASATGLTTASISALKDRFSSLDGFNLAEIFDETTNGISLNEEAVRRLEAAYEEQTKGDIDAQLQAKVEEYNNLSKAIDECSSASERAMLYSQRNEVLNQINDTAMLAAQYDGLTSAYNKWVQAQSGSKQRTPYEQVGSSYSSMKDLLDQGWTGDDSLQEYVNMLVNAKDLTGDMYTDFDHITETIEGTSHNLMDYWTFDENNNLVTDGLYDFLDDVNKLLGDEFVKISESGEYSFDFSGDKLDQVAEKFGTTTQTVELFADAMKDAGMAVTFDDTVASLELVKSKAEEANQHLKELGKVDTDFHFDSSDIGQLNGEISHAAYLLKQMKDSDGTINVNLDEYTEMKTILESLIAQKQSLCEPAIMSIDTSQLTGAEEDIIAVISDMQELQKLLDQQEAAKLTGDVSLEVSDEEINAAVSELNNDISNLSVESKAKIGVILDDTGITEQLDKIMNGEDGKSGLKLHPSMEISEEDLTGLKDSISNIELEDIEVAISDNKDDILADLDEVETYELHDKQFDVAANGLDDALAKVKELDDLKLDPKTLDVVTNVTTNTTENVTTTTTSNSSSGSNSSSSKSNNSSSSSTSKSKGSKTSTSSGTSKGRNKNQKAFASGSKTIRASGIALGGEEGPELHVHKEDGYYDIVGKDGAEMFAYNKGDLVFDAEQTEQLLKDGKIKTGNLRGIALAKGTFDSFGEAFANGASGGTGSRRRTPSSTKSASALQSSTSSKSSSSKSSSLADEMESSADATENMANSISNVEESMESTVDAAEDLNEEEDKFLETVDWIEVALNRVQEAYDRVEKVASSSYNNAMRRDSAMVKEMEVLRQQIATNEAAYQGYMNKANSVPLSDYYKGLIQTGAIGVEDFTDENLKQMVDDYQTWYEKAIACKDAMQDLKQSIADVAQAQFDNIQSDFDGRLSQIEHKANMLNESVTQVETGGYIASKDFYKELTNIENSNIAVMKEEANALRVALQDALNTGEIEVYSEAWYGMVGEINAVDEAIQQANTSLIEYANTMRQIDWDFFDRMQDNISDIVDESDFMVDLMSHKNLFTEKGVPTEYGVASEGLHAVNYNVKMSQADEYRKEIDNLNSQLASDPYNTELIERRNELIKLQQDAILGAQDEMEAIRDLVSDGYDLQLSYLQKLIDKRKDALNSERDLYQYQKEVQEKSQNIADYQKQLQAYSGDDSEEARATVQQLQASLKEAQEDLAETEYDKWVEDQERLLDDLYDEYEYLLNSRLDNLDAVVHEVIDQTNLNMGTIGDTLNQTTTGVGYNITDTMHEIWNPEGGITKVVTDYTTNFSTVMTGVQGGIDGIKGLLEQMKVDADTRYQEEKQKVAETTTNVPSAPSAAPPPTPSSQVPTLPQNYTYTNDYMNQQSGNSPSNSSSSSSGSSGSYSTIGSSSSGYGSGSGSSSGAWGSWFIYSKDSYPKNSLHSDGSIVDRLKYRNYDSSYSARASYYAAMGGTGTYTGSSSQNDWMVEQMKQHGFAKGGITKLVRASGEDGIGFLRSGEGIIPKEMMGEWQAFVKAIPSFVAVADNLSKMPSSNSYTDNNTSATNEFTSTHMEVVLPNVMDYNSFVDQMQKDKRFEKIVQSMTIGNVMGKNKLSKYNY